MTKIDSNKALVISIVLLLVVVSGIVYYYNNQIKVLNENFDTRLVLLNKDILGNINTLQEDVDQTFTSLKNNLSMEIGLVDNNLQNFRKKNDKDIKTINSLIDEIEKQSDIKLNELKEEISTIQVESTDFSSIINEVLKSVVSIGTNVGQGSGAVIDGEGFIVTNHHVIDGATIIRVLTNSGEVYDASLIGFDEVVDVAVLKVDASLDTLRFEDSDDVNVGERVIALGNPVGLSFTVTEGIVSALKRKGPNDLSIYIQTDVPINPGNSGGPLVDTNSRIIGLNNFKIGGFEGLGFAIESNVVKEIVDDIINQYREQITS
ncbi:trypsin-like peptidase domain-containing protein [Candidatus Woesearchaeota archaeon]|nr:trypsin-like peptidase domain-containing protein [Candidatus Woesearchaeota archaeon]